MTKSSRPVVNGSGPHKPTVSGASWARTIVDISVPLVKSGILAAWIMVFAVTLRELSMAILLYVPGTETLPVAIYSFIDNGTFEIGAAASVVLVSGRYLDEIGRDKNKTVRLFGYGHTTDYLPLDKKDAPTFSTARKAAEKAFRMANLTPRDLHGADVHDCFSITEIVAYEILGLAELGKGVDLVKSGATTLPAVRPEKSNAPFQIPVNAGGGLIGDGHPVGATGVRQVFEAYQQLSEQAGARQIENAKRFLTFNMGGSLTTSVAMLWGRD